MKNYFFFITFFLLISFDCQSQNDFSKYFYIDIYSSISYQKQENLNVELHSDNSEIEQKEKVIFYVEDIRVLDSVSIKIGKQEFTLKLPYDKLNSKFVLLKVYLNTNTNQSYSYFKRGDVIYNISECTKVCNYVEIQNISLIYDNDLLTTGYKPLDKYIILSLKNEKR